MQIYGLLTSNGIMLDIVSLDEPAVDNHMEHSATKAANKAGLELMSKMVRTGLCPVWHVRSACLGGLHCCCTARDQHARQAQLAAAPVADTVMLPECS